MAIPCLACYNHIRLRYIAFDSPPPPIPFIPPTTVSHRLPRFKLQFSIPVDYKLWKAAGKLLGGDPNCLHNTGGRS